MEMERQFDNCIWIKYPDKVFDKKLLISPLFVNPSFLLRYAAGIESNSR